MSSLVEILSSIPLNVCTVVTSRGNWKRLNRLVKTIAVMVRAGNNLQLVGHGGPGERSGKGLGGGRVPSQAGRVDGRGVGRG